MKGKRMCPNEACGRFNQPTGLMGGCDCGAALVPYKSLDDQVNEALWNLMSPGIKRMVPFALAAQEWDRRGGPR